MQILIVGNGGREHAIAYKIAQSPLAKQIWVAPGNAGTAMEPTIKNTPIAADDIPALITFAKQHAIDLTIIGPEAPLSAGIVDAFKDAGLMCFGPTQKAAELESSKIFSKTLMDKYNIPTAKSITVNTQAEAQTAITAHTYPLVIKADGLAAGKGVFISHTPADAEAAILELIAKHHFGQPGQSLLIEQFLEGTELSYIVLANDETIISLASSQDHKRLGDNDQGPNTGGMGAISPSPYCSAELEQRILTTVIKPTLAAMKQEGRPFQGFLYAGLMIGLNEDISVLEFNVRLGDPETQVILPRLQSDLLETIIDLQAGKQTATTLLWDKRPAIGVVMASGGYPGQYTTGLTIDGLTSHWPKDCFVFHAGTLKKDNTIQTAGGRVLCVSALADTQALAQKKAYKITKTISWPNCYYRSDIGEQRIQYTEKTRA